MSIGLCYYKCKISALASYSFNFYLIAVIIPLVTLSCLKNLGTHRLETPSIISMYAQTMCLSPTCWAYCKKLRRSTLIRLMFHRSKPWFESFTFQCKLPLDHLLESNLSAATLTTLSFIITLFLSLTLPCSQSFL